LKALFAIERFVVRIETIILVAFLSTMVLLSFSQVVMRNLFDTGLLWGDTLVRHLVLWVGFTGAAIATSEERHISMDVFSKLLPLRVRYIAHIVTNGFALYICYLLAGAAYTFFLSEKSAGGTLVLDIPAWVGLLVIPPGYLLMVFHFGVKLLKSVAEALGKTQEVS